MLGLTETVTGLAQIMHLPVLVNQDVVLVHKFNMKKMLDAIVKYRANELWLVPRQKSCLLAPVDRTLTRL